jgi:hypothetical protein
MAKNLYRQIFEPHDLLEEDGHGNVRLNGNEAEKTLKLAVRYLREGIISPGDEEALEKLKKAFPRAWDQAQEKTGDDDEAAEQLFLSGLSAGYDGKKS